MLQDFLGCGAKIAVTAVSRRERNFSLAGYFPDRAPQQRAPYLQCSFFPGGKGPAGEKYRGLGCFLHRMPTEVFRHQSDFLQFLGGGGNRVGSQGKGLHHDEDSNSDLFLSFSSKFP
jgi:hypothetical protein